MGGILIKLSVLILVVAVYWKLWGGSKPAPEELGRGSFVAPGWEKVEEKFREQLKSGLLTAGGFSVYHKGKCVVDLTGGYANEDSFTLWDNKTISLYFSTTKGVASLVIAMLVDRGLLDYNKAVSTYWPEFAQNGKKDITVEQLISHQAGLITVNDGNYSLNGMKEENRKEFDKKLAAEKPFWEPGTGLGYHAFTKGFYEDALVRRVDPKRRSMQKFFKEEVADVFGIDFHIGAPREQFYRVAQNHQASMMTTEVMTDPKLWHMVWMVATSNNPLFQKSLYTTETRESRLWNNPDFLSLNSPSTHGMGTAQSLAKLYGIIANGGVYQGKTLLSKKMIKKLGQVVVSGKDLVLGIEWTMGPGVMLLPSPKEASDIGKFVLTEKEDNMFGTPGAGGQMACADTQNQLGVSYLTNHMSFYGPDDPRFIGLMTSVYETLKVFK